MAVDFAAEDKHISIVAITKRIINHFGEGFFETYL